MARRRIASAALLAALAVESIASAQTSPTLRLESDVPSTEYRVHAGRSAASPFVACSAPCAIAIAPGWHRIEAHPPGAPSGDTTEFVYDDTRVVTRAGSSTARTVGLVVAVVGMSAAVITLGGAYFSDCFGVPNGCETERAARDAKEQKNAFLVAAGVSAVVGVLGWVVFAVSDTSVTAKAKHRKRVVSVDVAPIVGGGAAFAVRGAF